MLWADGRRTTGGAGVEIVVVHRRRLPVGAALLDMAPVLYLLQRGALGGELDHLELEQPEPAAEA